MRPVFPMLLLLGCPEPAPPKKAIDAGSCDGAELATLQRECLAFEGYEFAADTSAHGLSDCEAGIAYGACKVEGKGGCAIACTRVEQVESPTSTTGKQRFEQVVTGIYHACALDDAGSVICWGDDSLGRIEPPPGPFLSLGDGSGSGIHTCGIRDDHEVACWGGDSNGEATPPSYEFVKLSTASGRSCGIIRDSLELACWGDSSNGATEVPGGQFASIELGGGGGAGISTDGRLHLWGADHYVAEAVPPDVLASSYLAKVSITSSGGCVLEQLQMTCWHNDVFVDYGIVDGVPDYQVTDFAFNGLNACAIDRDGNLECWGNCSDGVCDAPAGQFVSVAIGQHFACAVTVEGDILCWGTEEASSGPP